MRPIDADALKPDADYDDGDYWAYSIGQVHFAQTIEPEREKGAWINEGRIIRCNICKIGYATVKGMKSALTYNFCPNCGADMR